MDKSEFVDAEAGMIEMNCEDIAITAMVNIDAKLLIFMVIFLLWAVQLFSA